MLLQPCILYAAEKRDLTFLQWARGNGFKLKNILQVIVKTQDTAMYIWIKKSWLEVETLVQEERIARLLNSGVETIEGLGALDIQVAYVDTMNKYFRQG